MVGCKGRQAPSPADALADRAPTAPGRYSFVGRSVGPGDDLRSGAPDQQHGLFSVPRWRFLAILAGSMLGLAIRLPRSRWSTEGRIVLLTLVTVVGLVSWFGYDQVVTRLGTFQEGLIVEVGASPSGPGPYPW